MINKKCPGCMTSNWRALKERSPGVKPVSREEAHGEEDLLSCSNRVPRRPRVEGCT